METIMLTYIAVLSIALAVILTYGLILATSVAYHDIKNLLKPKSYDN